MLDRTRHSISARQIAKGHREASAIARALMNVPREYDKQVVTSRRNQAARGYSLGIQIIIERSSGR